MSGRRGMRDEWEEERGMRDEWEETGDMSPLPLQLSCCELLQINQTTGLQFKGVRLVRGGEGRGAEGRIKSYLWSRILDFSALPVGHRS